MCGRFTLAIETPALQQEFGVVTVPPDWVPRFNVAPTQPIAVITDAEERKLEWMHWGLVPFWAKDPSIGSRLINARSETAHEKPAFRAAFARRRCLILADGFYEWQKPVRGKGPKNPFYFRRKDSRPFAFAGLWERWDSPEGNMMLSATILTTSANELVKPVHERMPVMLSGDNLWRWLQEELKDALQSMLAPYPEVEMAAYPISRMVNRAEMEGPQLIRPLA